MTYRHKTYMDHHKFLLIQSLILQLILNQSEQYNHYYYKLKQDVIFPNMFVLIKFNYNALLIVLFRLIRYYIHMHLLSSGNMIKLKFLLIPKNYSFIHNQYSENSLSSMTPQVIMPEFCNLVSTLRTLEYITFTMGNFNNLLNITKTKNFKDRPNN